MLSFVAALNIEQVSITASVLLEHYVKITANITTPHTEDIEGLQIILFLMNRMAVQSRAESFTMQPNSMGGLPLHSATPQYAIQVPSNSRDAAQFSQLTGASHSRGDMHQYIQVASNVFSGCNF